GWPSQWVTEPSDAIVGCPWPIEMVIDPGDCKGRSDPLQFPSSGGHHRGRGGAAHTADASRQEDPSSRLPRRPAADRARLPGGERPRERPPCVVLFLDEATTTQGAAVAGGRGAVGAGGALGADEDHGGDSLRDAAGGAASEIPWG